MAALYLMALPTFAIVFIFSYIPMFGIILAFKDYNVFDGVFGSPWVGFKNFEFFFKSGVAWRLIKNTLGLNFLFMITTQLLGILTALMLNEIFEKKLAKVYQSVLFFPHFISFVIVGYFSYALLNVDNGLLNNLLAIFGIEGIDWYGNSGYWPHILNTISAWKGVGYYSIIYLAAISSVNPEYYEALRVDGGKKRHEMWYITLPSIRPLIFINVLLSIGRIFYANFDFFKNVVRDNPLLMSVADVIDTYVIRTLTVVGDFNMASAAGVFQGICGFILIIAANMVVRKIDSDSAMF